ncbi:MAG: hypothetical protein JWO71_2706 [Candidatus Acidoferrum typicum]|nr:hypothetical protein [Candidatus Acidoferrum typicum]
MNKRFRGNASFLITLALGVGVAAAAQTPSAAPQKESVVSNVASGHAGGPFDVKVAPLPPEDKTPDATLGRFSIDKQYHGDLEGTGKGQMLTAGTAVKGSAAYVAIERVSGTLHGRTGSFVLQHTGTMNSNAFHLTITVVPDSGTEQLTGLTGTMNIIIAPDGKHSYDFTYTLPQTK